MAEEPMGPRLTDDELVASIDHANLGTWKRAVSDAATRKALTWAGETISDEHVELTLDWGCGGWLANRLEELARELGIEPWPTA